MWGGRGPQSICLCFRCGKKRRNQRFQTLPGTLSRRGWRLHHSPGGSWRLTPGIPLMRERSFKCAQLGAWSPALWGTVTSVCPGALGTRPPASRRHTARSGAEIRQDRTAACLQGPGLVSLPSPPGCPSVHRGAGSGPRERGDSRQARTQGSMRESGERWGLAAESTSHGDGILGQGKWL